jgi:hypothetical protein
MLADPRFTAEARRIRDLYAAVDGPGNAAEAIIELTGRPGGCPSRGQTAAHRLAEG